MDQADHLAPRDQADVVAAVEAAVANDEPLKIDGSGSKSGYGRPVEATRTLTTAGLSGVLFYEAEELVMSARAGTAMREVAALLRQQGQQLAFDPPDPSRLYGGEPGAGTVGGVFATNLSGSRRITAGAARDHLLGFQAVSGRAEVFKSGGRVMKNVTGYDLSKLITGSNGTLAVMTEVTFKVVPRPETEITLRIDGLTEERALGALRAASASSHEVSCLACLPQADGAGASVLLRLEGLEISVTSRRDALKDMLSGEVAAFSTIDETASGELWSELRDGAPVANAQGPVWRISVAPTAALTVMRAIRTALPVASAYYDWAGGLIWLGLDEPRADCGADVIRSAVDTGGGHATLMRASADRRAAVAVFHPQPAPLAALTARVKDAFDPKHVLNRGRMHAAQ